MHFASAPIAFVLFPLLSSLASCQQMLEFGNGAIPNCAESCSTLQAAQTGCIPAGGAPVSTPETYKSCFCASSLLTELKSGSAPTLCAANCADTSTRNQIATWYNNYCSSGQLPQAGTGGSAGTGTGTGSPSPAPAGGSSQTTGSDDGGSTPYNPGSWWDQHAKWIAMAIVLIVGFALIIAGALWYKKRYYRKRERALSQGQPSSWGPTRGATYPSSEKFGQDESYASSPDPNRSSSRQGKRLSKLVGR